MYAGDVFSARIKEVIEAQEYLRLCLAAGFLEDFSRISRGFLGAGFFKKSLWPTCFLLGFIEDFR